MIIKIMETEKDSSYFDSIGEVFVSKGPRSQFAGDDATNVFWIDPTDIRMPTTSDEPEYMKMTFIGVDGGSKAIITFCPTYLLNANGKTIERLI